MRLRITTDLILITTTIAFFLVGDIISTIACYHHFGSFDNEQSIVLKTAYDTGGLPAFIALKTGICLVCIGIAYYLIIDQNTIMTGRGILTGFTISGILVTTANTYTAINGYSIPLPGPLVIAILTLIPLTTGLTGYACDSLHKPIRRPMAALRT